MPPSQTFHCSSLTDYDMRDEGESVCLPYRLPLLLDSLVSARPKGEGDLEDVE